MCEGKEKGCVKGRRRDVRREGEGMCEGKEKG